MFPEPQSVVRVRCAEMKILKSGRDIGACLTGLEGTQAQSLRGYTNKMKLKILLIILTLLLCIAAHLFHYKTKLYGAISFLFCNSSQ